MLEAKTEQLESCLEAALEQIETLEKELQHYRNCARGWSSSQAVQLKKV